MLFLVRCLPLGLLGFLLLGNATSVHAQDKKGERVRFDTVDGVEIHGTFWSSTRGRRAPVALLLHRVGGKGSHEDEWDKLAEELQKQGFAVLSFDFRGHGMSTSVGEAFWLQPYNQRLVRGYRRGATVRDQPTTIALADFSPKYIPVLVNDIAAARLYLERRNDSNDCNVSNLVVIGAEEGATLGALWLAAETHRHRLLPNAVVGLPPRLNNRVESKDVIACVWLSMSRTLGRGNNVSAGLNAWLLEAGREQRIPMGFVYGAKDTTGDRNALAFVRAIKPSYQRGQKPTPQDDFPATGDYGDKEGAELVGSKLLNSKTGVINWITRTYLEKAVLEKFGGNEWEKRETEKFPFIWLFGRRQISAKNVEEKFLQPLPLFELGLR